MLKKPWNLNWDIGNTLGQGGQGHTSIAVRKDSFIKAVIKRLRDPKDLKARRRMKIEVTQLKILKAAELQVPEVLEDNVDDAENLEISLYFIMEFISGQTLAKIIDTSGPLPLETAIKLTLGLLETSRCAWEDYSVLHRDIKPENIIVTDLKSSNSVFIDFGLSFNHKQEDHELTGTSEQIVNSFCYLPERASHSGRNREFPSDLTLLNAILFYCLTAQRPRNLDDGKGNAPHRRHGQEITRLNATKPQVRLLNLFFDRAFQVDVDLRFQNAKEVSDRLARIISDKETPVESNPELTLHAVAKSLLASSRPVQIQDFIEKSQGWFKDIKNYFDKLKTPTLFLRHEISFSGEAPAKPKTSDDLGVDYSVVIRLRDHHLSTGIRYRIFSTGPECGLYRSMYDGMERIDAGFVKYTEWIPVVFWMGLDGPQKEVLDIILVDFKASIEEVAIRLRDRVPR